jgi:hypothetical protein
VSSVWAGAIEKTSITIVPFREPDFPTPIQSTSFIDSITVTVGLWAEVFRMNLSGARRKVEKADFDMTDFLSGSVLDSQRRFTLEIFLKNS